MGFVGVSGNCWLDCYGNKICNSLAQGFLEFKYFLGLNEQEIIDQIRFIDNIEIQETNKTYRPQKNNNKTLSDYWLTSFSEQHTLTVLKDAIELSLGYNGKHTIQAGQQVIIPKNILYSVSAYDHNAIINLGF